MSDNFDANSWYVEQNADVSQINNASNSIGVGYPPPPFDYPGSAVITNENVNEYVKKLNPNIQIKRIVLLVLAAVVTVLSGALTFLYSMEFMTVLLFVAPWLWIAFCTVNNRESNMKKSVLALGTAAQFDKYCNELQNSQQADFKLRCGADAIFTEDNMIIPAENVCLVYIKETGIKFIFSFTVGRQLVIGMTNGETIKYGFKVRKKKLDFIASFLLSKNPYIMLGATDDNLRRFNAIKNNQLHR